MVDKKIGQLLKEYRKKKKLSQEAIAAKLNISKDYVSKIEKGDRDPSERTKAGILVLINGISELGQSYGVVAVHRELSPDQERWLKMLEEFPEARESFEALVHLPKRNQKIHLGDILKDLVKEERKGDE